MLRTQQQDEQPTTEPSPGDDSERAGRTRDPNDSAEAVSAIEEHLRQSSHRLADLDVFVDSAEETPGTEILQAEFYFGRPAIRSAVIHRCASQGGRQYAMAWLFEPAEPDLNLHLPAAEVTVTADGKAYVSAGCPIDYPFRPQARPVNHPNTRAAVEAPEAAIRRTASTLPASASTSVPPRRARLVGGPLFLLVILAGSFFLYRDLIAPALSPSETTAARPEGEPPTVVAVNQESRIAPELSADAPEPLSVQTEDPVLLEEEPAASDDEHPALQTERAVPTIRAPSERSTPASRPTLSYGKTSPSERRSIRRPDASTALPPRSSKPLHAPPSRAPTIAAAPSANLPAPAAVDQPIAIGGTPGDGVETTQPVPKEKPAPPVVAREARPTPAPAAKKQRQQVAVENSWLTRMRAELAACGRTGIFRNDVCREVTRFRYCHPDRWHTVAECAVESFPQPLSSVISPPFYAETGPNEYSLTPLRSRV